MPVSPSPGSGVAEKQDLFLRTAESQVSGPGVGRDATLATQMLIS